MIISYYNPYGQKPSPKVCIKNHYNQTLGEALVECGEYAKEGVFRTKGGRELRVTPDNLILNEGEVFSREDLDVEEYYYKNLRLNELSKSFKGTPEETKLFIQKHVDRMQKQNEIIPKE